MLLNDILLHFPLLTKLHFLLLKAFLFENRLCRQNLKAGMMIKVVYP